MELWGWLVVAIVIVGVFLAIAGELVIALVLTAVWVGAIWLLVTYGSPVMQAVWPAILMVVVLVGLTIVTLAVLASALEDRRMKKDRGRAAPPL